MLGCSAATDLCLSPAEMREWHSSSAVSGNVPPCSGAMQTLGHASWGLSWVPQLQQWEDFSTLLQSLSTLTVTIDSATELFLQNNIRELKFNTTATCPFPLVPVPPPSGITMFTDPQRHYPGLEGCSLPCETPLFSPNELERLQRLIAWGGTIAVILNLFVVVS